MRIPALLLTATTERRSVALGAQIPVQLVLANPSDAPVWVNRRMGLGYEDGIEREIYFHVLNESGEVLPIPDEARVDAHRSPLRQSDFQLLTPGEQVTTDVNLALWYPFTKPGRYRVLFCYENTTDGRVFGVEAFTGRITADALAIEIR
jgi:hypothetical protein